MNAVVQFQPQQAPALSFTMSDMERVALAIAKGGLFGSNDPNAVLTLCMLAHAEGQHPAVVFRDYHMISGKPSKKAEAMQRDFLSAGGKIEWHRLDDDCADATFSHPQGGTARIAWDKARVAQAQLGGNAMHKKYPRQMLRSRVISEGVRTVFPGATSGLYETGEVQDMVEQDKGPTPPAPQAQRARDLKPVPVEPSPTAREKAEQWLATYTADLNAATDAEQLAAIHAKADKAVTKLEREFPDLHEQALALRPPVQGTDEHPARTVADRIITAAATATTIIDLNSLRSDSAEHIEAMPEDLAGEVRRALGEAEQRLGRK
jgi:hypothetical protein